ncbi:hypothetical protein [Streptosporangium lutulentum]|uniref:hypothetical protein n=1 Tax=Streptosporangium lutulentum TaxID=1461250 RepID=UPI00363193E2
MVAPVKARCSAISRPRSHVNELHAWAALPGFGAHLIHGVGGQGKTRLAGQLTEAGWATVWLNPRTSPQALEEVKLIIVDYAESRTGQLQALLKACAQHHSATPIKILLLARTAGSWWDNLNAMSATAEALLDGTPVNVLPALESDPSGRAGAYRDAARAFAVVLDVTTAPVAPGHSWAALAAGLPERLLRRVGLDNALTVRMSALADLLDTALAPPATTGVRTEVAGFTSVTVQGVGDRLLRLLQAPAIDPADLQRWADGLPPISYALAEWAARLTQRLVTYHRTHTGSSALATSLNNLSNRLGELGRREEGLAASTEATETYRRLAETRPEVHQRDLERSLEVLAWLRGITSNDGDAPS